MKRLTRAALLSTLLMLGGAAAVHAGEDTCTVDPPLQIRTPAGNSVVVMMTDSALGLEHKEALKAAVHTYVTTPALGGTATDVVLTVLVPGDIYAATFPVSTVASSGPWATGTIYASADGVAGTPMTLSFRLNVP